ncbi:MAG TPA: diaminopimelate epimerase [archaeon]|nr:diaminopimelate epimerase [archaeon]
MKFYKYHGLGNDYLVLDPAETVKELSIEQIRLICHRNYGVGSDGLLIGPFSGQGRRFVLRVMNPDGSEAEKSGNGIRIFSRYLWDKGRVKDEPFEIMTKGGAVRSQVKGKGIQVTVEMGQACFRADKIPVAGEPREVLNEEISAPGRKFRFSAATIGNPHCVILCEEVTKEEACKYGPVVETDARFLNRTNVQFMKVLDRNNIRIEIWERGAGYTLASGSSSCASAAVAHRLDLCDKEITVHMPGGKLEITIGDNYMVTMTGPVARVFEGVICEELLSRAL